MHISIEIGLTWISGRKGAGQKGVLLSFNIHMLPARRLNYDL